MGVAVVDNNVARPGEYQAWSPTGRFTVGLTTLPPNARAQMFEELNQMAGRIWIRGITKELLLSDQLTRFVDELRAQTGSLRQGC